MFYIVTALMLEAAPLIRHFNLKKDLGRKDFPVFRRADIILVVSGTGKMQAAMAVAAMLTANPPTEHDILLNIGFCGIYPTDADAKASSSVYGSTRQSECTNRVEHVQAGTMLSIWKVTDMDTGRDLYPDVLYDLDCPAAVLQCHAAPVISERSGMSELSEKCATPEKCGTPEKCEECATRVKEPDSLTTRPDPPQVVAVDMESAGIMAAARIWLAPHQVILLKLVSDHLDPVGQARTTANKTRLDRFITDQLAMLDQVIASWYTTTAPDRSRRTVSVLPESDTALLEQVAATLHLTVAMRRLLTEDIRKARLLGTDPMPVLKKALDLKPQGKAAARQMWLQLRKEILSDG